MALYETNKIDLNSNEHFYLKEDLYKEGLWLLWFVKLLK